MSGSVLGIDLGTTNSAVAVADGVVSRVLADGEGRRLVPSVVSFHSSGKVLVGYDARERRLVDAENTVYAVKRLIGRPYDSPEVARAKERFAFKIVPSSHGGTVVDVRKGKYALAEISAIVLRELKRMAEASLGTSAERAVVTVPASFNELQRSATKAAGKVAGLDVLRILNEPTAAALAYGIGQGNAKRVAVYDLGGGTFDITILELESDVFEVVATAGDTFLGGEDIDLAVAETMADAFASSHGMDLRSDRQAFERLRAAGEWAKCQLSSEEEVDLSIEELAMDRRGKRLDLEFAMTRADLEVIAEPLLMRSLQVCDQALRTASMKASDLDAVVLVGGSTRMPRVRQLVEQYFGREPRVDHDPDLVVCQGAAIHGFAIGGGPRKIAPPPKPVAVPKPVLSPVEGPEAPSRKQPAFAPPEPPRRETIDWGVDDADEAPAKPALALLEQSPHRETIAFGSPFDQEQPQRGTVEWGVDAIDAIESALAPPVAPAEHEVAVPLVRRPPRPKDDIDKIESGTRTTRSTLEAELDALEPSVSRSTIEADLDALDPDRPSGLGKPLSRSTLDGDLDMLAPDTPILVKPIDRSTREDLDLLDPDSRTASAPQRTTNEELEALALDLPAPRTLGSDIFDLDDLEPAPSAPSLPVLDDDRPSFEELGPIAFGNAPALPSIDQPFDPSPPPVAKARGVEGRAKPPPVPNEEPPKRRRDPTVQFGTERKPPPVPPAAAERKPREPTVQFGTERRAPEKPVEKIADLGAAIETEMGQPSREPTLRFGAGDGIVAMPEQTPLLMDVTPLALSVETAGGFCRTLIARNAPVPAEHKKVFTTASDDQSSVTVRICQGNSSSFEQNQVLGEVVLADLPARARGKAQIEIAFQLDSSGTLSVHARDLDTGKAQVTRIDLRGGLSDDEIAQMRDRQLRELG